MRADSVKLALAHHAATSQQKPVRDALGQIVPMMRHHDQARAIARNLFQRLHKFGLRLEVQSVKWLVAEENFRLVHQRPQKEYFAELAIRHLQHPFPGQGGEPERVEKCPNLFLVQTRDFLDQADTGKKT